MTDWPGLQPRQMNVLAKMALMSMDGAAPPVYFARRGNLAGALGYSSQDIEAVDKTLEKVMKELRETGAVVWSQKAYAGTKAVYALALDPLVTYEPKWQGEDLQWVRVPRDPEEVSGLRPRNGKHAVKTPRNGGAVQKKDALPEMEIKEKAPLSRGKEAPRHGGAEPPSYGGKRPPLTGGPTTSDFNTYFNQTLQPTSPSRIKSPARARGSDDLVGNLNLEEERNRQLLGLQERIEQQKEAS